jgi:hypothetical protein
MTRIKSLFAVLALILMGIAPRAHAQTLKTLIAGASSQWQTLALAAENNGTSLVAGGGQTFHYTSSSNFNLIDSRGGTTTDTGQIWIVWDSNTAGADVWAFVSVDSVTGSRCYFAVPKCTVSYPGTTLPTPANAITVWPDGTSDTQPPASVAALFADVSQTVNVAATDIRPEDAVFAECRVNSPLGAGSAGGAASDQLDGLGYSQAAATQAAGACYAFTTTAQGAINGIGHPIVSGYPASTKKANVLAFAISGKDPITGTKIAAYTVYPIGAAPVVFLTNRQHNLANLANVSEQQLQQVLSGTNCDGGAFGAAFAGPINIFLRDPQSGTYNVVEATVARYPTVYPNPVIGLSQETNVNAPANNYELNGYASACATGAGQRWRTIGTSEEIKAVYNSNGSAFGTNARDGIGYAYFSYGNANTSGTVLSDSPNYGYLQLDNVDPIWASYGIGQAIDPGEPTVPGELPSQVDLPSAAVPTGCASSFPCPENKIWGGGASFPNLRNGTYRSWSVLRLIATGTAGTNAAALITAAEKAAVLVTPDFVPITAQTITAAENPLFGYAITDKGLLLLRSHYQQYDGSGVDIGVAAVNEPTTSEKGGDMGGLVIPTSIGVTLSASAASNTENQKQIVQSSNPTTGGLGPAIRAVVP